jgi:MscS family membrane protein
MMVFENMQNPLENIFGSFEPSYGWLSEILALLAFVLLFNLLLKGFLAKLQNKLKKRHSLWQDSFVNAIAQPIMYFVSFYAFIHIIDLVAFHTFSTDISANLSPFLTLGAVLSFSWFLFRWKSHIIANLSLLIRHKKIAFDHARVDVIDKLATAFIVFFTVLILLESTHKSLNTLIAFGGIGGLALAFASQEVISNFFGGVMIYATQPFSKGDWIQVPDRNIEGIVEEIGWYMTLVRSLDKRPIYVPNSIFTKTVVVTPSRMTHRRFKETISLRYADMPALKNILKDIYKMLEKHADVDPQNTLIVNLDGFGPHSLDVVIQADLTVLDSAGFARAKDALLFAIAQIVADHKAEFAGSSHIYLAPKTLTP